MGAEGEINATSYKIHRVKFRSMYVHCDGHHCNANFLRWCKEGTNIGDARRCLRVGSSRLKYYAFWKIF